MVDIIVTEKFFDAERLFGTLYLAIGEFSFPCVGWTDFAEDILSTWARELLRLSRERPSRFTLHFMDGPYALDISKDGAAKLAELIPAADEIVIARGDLGNSGPLWKLPALQKRISAACREAGRPFMVVTQMLASMEQNPVPTRAEVSDIFNAVLDGAASVMVTGETAVGKYPVEAMRYLVNTVREAEAYLGLV